MAVQETPLPVKDDDIKLTVAPNAETTASSPPTAAAPSESAAPQRIDPPPAIASTPSPTEKPAAKRARVRIAQYPSWASWGWATRARVAQHPSRVPPLPPLETSLVSACSGHA